MLDKGVTVLAAVSLLSCTNVLCELVLNGSKAFRRERFNSVAGVELQEYLDSITATVIMGRVVSLGVIQKSDTQRIDCYAPDCRSRLSRIVVGGDCPLSNASGIVLLCFGGAELTEVDSFSVDSDEGGASVVAHFRGRGL
jgi:hypothetical protein